jgi:hypothetical protein
MKAQRATVELGMLGGWYVVAGLAALLHAADNGVPEVGTLAAVLGALAGVGSVWVIGMAVHRLREIEGLPETAQRVSVLWVAARASLLAVLPVAAVVFVSMSSTSAGQTLGVAYAVLGGAICTAAVLATHVEYLCGARVWRCNSRFYFAR